MTVMLLTDTHMQWVHVKFIHEYAYVLLKQHLLHRAFDTFFYVRGAQLLLHYLTLFVVIVEKTIELIDCIIEKKVERLLVYFTNASE